MSTPFQAIKNNQYPVFQSHSPFEVASIQKKLIKHARHHRTEARHTIEPAICPNCECPIGWDEFCGYTCQCDPDQAGAASACEIFIGF